jgi:hypothetical protein
MSARRPRRTAGLVFSVLGVVIVRGPQDLFDGVGGDENAPAEPDGGDDVGLDELVGVAGRNTE